MIFIKVHAYLYETSVVSSLEVSLSLTFLHNNGVPHSQLETLNLPLSLVIKPCPPIKDADFKVVLPQFRTRFAIEQIALISNRNRRISYRQVIRFRTIST